MNLFKKRTVQISLFLIIALILGFIAGYEYRGYEIRRDIKETFSKAFPGAVSDVSQAANSDEAAKDQQKELSVGQSFTDNGLTISVLEIKRSDTAVTLSDGTKLDSRLGFRVKVENNTAQDKQFNDANFSLKSRVDDNKITKMIFMDDNKNFAPELAGDTLIDGAKTEGWITYFLPKSVANSDLQILYDNNNTKVKFRLQ